MPTTELGNGDDVFNGYLDRNDTSIFGGNGNDIIAINFNVKYPPLTGTYVDGGNGDDWIILGNASNTVAFGGNGNDKLTSSSFSGNTLQGGNGDDLLISEANPQGSSSTTLTGGLGQDTFQFVDTFNAFSVKSDAGNADGVVSNGDVFSGGVDVITDLEHGDHITLHSSLTNTDSPPLTQVAGASLVTDPLSYLGNDYLPTVGDGNYAVFHGTFASNGGTSFTVGSSGPDLFVVYNPLDGNNDPLAQGSFVLLGVTDEQLVAEAFSSATMPNAGSGQYTYDFPGSGSSPNQTGGIHVANFDGSNSPSIGVPPGNLITA